MDLGLKGKTAVVTGGGSNIGRGISLAFAREGANVVIAELDEVQGKKVVQQATTLGTGGKTIAVKTDVTDLSSVENVVKQAIDTFGAIDVWVNNVGWDQVQLFVETTPEFWDKVISLNYKSDLNCFKEVLPHMIERKKGSIVSLGSDAGRMGEFREAVYGGCKGAVIAFSKAIAREVGRYGVRVNVVCPGVTIPAGAGDVGEKSMWKAMGFTPEQLEKMKGAYPLRKIGTPEDVAGAVLFLASDVAAGHITGQTLSVSGGYTMM